MRAGAPQAVALGRALVVADDRAARSAFCAELAEAGYDPVAFDACGDAIAWLDEETPAVAMVRMRRDRHCARLVEQLQERSVQLVVDGAPVAAAA